MDILIEDLGLKEARGVMTAVGTYTDRMEDADGDILLRESDARRFRRLAARFNYLVAEGAVAHIEDQMDGDAGKACSLHRLRLGGRRGDSTVDQFRVRAMGDREPKALEQAAKGHREVQRRGGAVRGDRGHIRTQGIGLDAGGPLCSCDP